MIINHNMKSINAHRMMGVNASGMGKSIEKLSSGLRINRAADDAAGLAISEKMRSQIRGMQQASRNAQDGISVVQTAEGALDEVHSMLQRMKQLAVQSANDSNQSLVDREALQLEVDQLTDEINSITDKTQFNKMRLLDGTFKDKKFHVGANQGETIDVSIKSMTAKGLGLKTGGTESLFAGGGETRVLSEKGFRVVTTAAKSFAATTEVIDAGDVEPKDMADKKATFNAVVNGKYTQFTVDLDTTDNKFKKEDIAAAAAKALNEAYGDDIFEAATAKVKIKAGKTLGPENFEIGANVKISLVNESKFRIENVAGLGKSAGDIVWGDSKAAVMEISHEKGYAHFEIALNGKEPKVVELTAEDNTQAAIQAKFKAVFGDDITVAYDPAVAGATTRAIITLTTKALGADATLDVRASGESARKTVDYRGVNILSREAANDSINNIQSAIENLASRRAELGAIQNRVEHTIKNLDNSAENLQAAESRVRDVDMADEMSKFTRANILTQASQAMLAQANQLPQQVLQLLR